MSTFGTSGDHSAERRRQRREEARRRVEAGEHTPPPPPTPTTRASRAGASSPASAVRTTRRSASRSQTPTHVDPTTGGAGTFAVWRSTQHFCTPDSLADAVGADLAALERWSASIMEFRLRPRVLAKLMGQEWVPVGTCKDGRREPISVTQAELLRDRRLGRAAPSKERLKPLGDDDHPAATVSL